MLLSLSHCRCNKPENTTLQLEFENPSQIYTNLEENALWTGILDFFWTITKAIVQQHYFVKRNIYPFKPKEALL